MNQMFFNLNTQQPVLFISIGESNSGAVGSLTQLPLDEQGIRNSVIIFNNLTFQFETLNVGVNNLLDHDTYTAPIVTFGVEVGIANRVRDNTVYSNPCYLLKAGHGGSRLSQWTTEGVYFTKFKNRLSTIKGLLGSLNYKVVIFLTIGINDFEDGLNPDTYKIQLKDFISRIRNEIWDSSTIFIPSFTGMGKDISLNPLPNKYNSFTDKILEVVSETENVYNIPTNGTTLTSDYQHWDGTNTGIKLVTSRMLDKLELINR